MQILYIHNIAMPGPEANTVNVAKMCDALAQSGAGVTLLAARGASPPQTPYPDAVRSLYGLHAQFPIEPMPSICARPIAAALFCMMRTRHVRADLVWTRAPHIALAGCLNNIQTLLEVHCDLTSYSALGKRAFRLVANHPALAGILVISNALQERIKAQFPHARIAVAPDGADENPFAEAPFLRSLRPQIGYVGHLYPGKGAELILPLAAHCPGMDFHIVGGMPSDRDRLFQDGVPGNVRLHPHIAHAEVPRLLAGFDILLAPYQKQVIAADGRTNAAPWMSPLKVFEYMASGRAIVASDLPALREILEHGRTAFLCAPTDVSQWVQALETLCRDRQLREGLAHRAKHVFQQHYTWRHRAENALAFITATPVIAPAPQRQIESISPSNVRRTS